MIAIRFDTLLVVLAWRGRNGRGSGSGFIESSFNRRAKAVLVELRIRKIVSVNHNRWRTLDCNFSGPFLVQADSFAKSLVVEILLKLIDVEPNRFRLVHQDRARCG